MTKYYRFIDKESNKEIIKKFVRMPCGNCKKILPGFTIKYHNYDNFKIIKELVCLNCGKKQRMTIKKSEDNIFSHKYYQGGYITSGITSLDWVRSDPTDELQI